MKSRILTVFQDIFGPVPFTRPTPTPRPTPVPTGPEAPDNFAATAYSSTAIGIDWDRVDDAARYVLMRNGTVLYDSNGTGYWDAGLQPGTSYTYTLDAYDSSGNKSNRLSITKSTNEG